MLDRFWQDLRIAIRTLARSPGAFLVAVLSLAIGIGANTTIFSALDVFLIRPLPYPDAERILRVWGVDRERGWTGLGFSAQDFQEYRRESRAVEFALFSGASFNLSGGEEPERVDGQLVSANLFAVLGVQPVLGRGFLPEEEARGAHRVVVLGDGLWRRRFGGDPRVVGSTVVLDGEPYAVVGVMPPAFRFLDNRVELWALLSFDGTEDRRFSVGSGVARIRPGYSAAQAEAELAGRPPPRARRHPYAVRVPLRRQPVRRAHLRRRHARDPPRRARRELGPGAARDPRGSGGGPTRGVGAGASRILHSRRCPGAPHGPSCRAPAPPGPRIHSSRGRPAVLTISLALILLLILANGVFAMSEIAVVSARKSRLRVSAAEGDVKARRALDLAESPSRFLATVQIGITLVGVFTGAFGATTIAQPLADLLWQAPALRPYALPLAVGAVVVGVTYVSLLLGELVPKRIALHSPERVAGIVAPLMHGLSVLARPAVWLMSVSTDAVVRLLGLGPRREPTVTEEEVAALLAEGTRAGVFREAELEVVERVFWLADETAETVMTPRGKIVWLDINDPREETIRTTIEHPHTRYIVCDGELDRVLGIVDLRDLWADLAAGESLDLRRRLRKPLFLPETILALNLLERFRSTGIHLAILLDEYGGITGIVTPSDILEGIVGQIEPGAARIVTRDDGSLLVDASLPMDELRRFLGVEEQRFPMPEGYRTLGGFILQRLGRVPMPGERVVDGGYCFEVVDLDGHRIDKVMVRPEQG